ncbi:MAG: DNA gyrase inhibitor YacG [Pseudobdellovibrionaceae bacterium]|nr:DNA gyrase inhibitor YacG [Bdellovibrionales bacterium]USN47296.1 MAG: DNA gyrase inhibitor YacG [Pseudobdellovibrionaceae bacterium]
MAKIVKCPQCGKDTEYGPENKYRPFCSERCQLIDLGEWAEEKYLIPAEEGPSRADVNEENEKQRRILH